MSRSYTETTYIFDVRVTYNPLRFGFGIEKSTARKSSDERTVFDATLRWGRRSLHFWLRPQPKPQYVAEPQQYVSAGCER